MCNGLLNSNSELLLLVLVLKQGHLSSDTASPSVGWAEDNGKVVRKI